MRMDSARHYSQHGDAAMPARIPPDGARAALCLPRHALSSVSRRTRPGHRLARSDVPSEVAAAIAEHVHAMHESDSDDDEPSEHLDAASVREMLSILAEFRYENRTLAVFTSRLIPDVETENDERQNFCPYRSFQRMLLNNAKRSTDTGITVRFQALHPILLEPIHSEHIPVASINGEFPMRCECTGSQVLASVLIAEPTVHVNVDVNAVQNICSNTIAAHIENFLRR